jgi:hypothetical protein
MRFGKSSRIELKLAIDSIDTTEIELWGNPASWLATNDLQLLDKHSQHPRCPRENEQAYLLYSTTLARDVFVCGGGAARAYGANGAFPIGMRSSTALSFPVLELGRQHMTLGKCTYATQNTHIVHCNASTNERAGGMCLTKMTLGTTQHHMKNTSIQVFSSDRHAVFDDTLYHDILRTTKPQWISLFDNTRIHLREFTQVSKKTQRGVFDIYAKKYKSAESFGDTLTKHFSFCMRYQEETLTFIPNTKANDVDAYTCVFTSIVLFVLFATNNSNTPSTMFECIYHGLCVAMITRHVTTYSTWVAISPIALIMLSTLSIFSLLPVSKAQPYDMLIRKLVFNTHCVAAIYCALSVFKPSTTLCIVNAILFCYGCYNGYFMLSRTIADAVFEVQFTYMHVLALLSSIATGMQLYVCWIDIDAKIHMFLLQQDTPYDSLGWAFLILLVVSENSTSSRFVLNKSGSLELHTNSHVMATHTLKSLQTSSAKHDKDVELSSVFLLANRSASNEAVLPVSSSKQVARRRVYPKSHSITRPMHRQMS